MIVEFNQDLDQDGYKAKNISIINTAIKTQSTQNIKKNLNEYELLKGVYFSKNAEFIDGEIIYASGYEISAFSEYSTEDALITLKESALDLGFNGLAFLETDKEVEISLATSVTSGSLSRGLGSSYSLSSMSASMGVDYKKYYAKARIVLLGLKSNTPSNINIDDYKVKLEAFKNTAKYTQSFKKRINKYISYKYIFNTDRVTLMGLILALITGLITYINPNNVFAVVIAAIFYFLSFVFIVIIPIIILIFLYYSISTSGLYLNKEMKTYKELSSILGDELYYKLYSSSSNVRIHKIGE